VIRTIVAVPRSKPKAYSYLRFSTPEQQRGDSFRRQTDAAVDYARRHDLQLDDSTYADLGVSGFRGKNLTEGKLGAFLEAVQAGAIARGSFLLVESLDRISRDNVGRALRALQNICDEGIKVVTLMDEKVYDEDSLNDPIGLIMSILMFARANEESATKGRRIQASWKNKREKAARGEVLTATCPAWMELDPATRKFKLIPDNAKAIRRVYELAAKGAGLEAIAKTFNREKVPVLGRAEYWHRSYISKILANPAVVGTLVPHTLEYVGGRKRRKPQEALAKYYPAAVPQKLYDAVQALRSNLTAPSRGRHANRPLGNLFAGLARCPHCQSGVMVENKGNYRYLRCDRERAGAECPGGRARYDLVEQAFLANAARVADGCPSDDEAAVTLQAEVKELGTTIDVAIDQIEELSAAAANGKLGTARAINDRIVELENVVADARARRDTASAQAEAMTGAVLRKRVEKLQAALNAERLDRAAVNLALRPLVSGVQIDFKHGEVLLQWKHGGEPGKIIYGGTAFSVEEGYRVKRRPRGRK